MEDKVKVKVTNFTDFESFIFYVEAHYLPLLDRLSEPGAVPGMADNDRRLLAFLHDDLTSMVNSYNNKEE